MSYFPLVSVIIPTFNNRDVVCDAIDSCLRQSCVDREIIVVDDGSTDGTGQMLNTRYGTSIRYILQENTGLSGARNTGLRYASGDYIQFLDADDLIDHDKLLIQVSQLRGKPDLSLAYSDYIVTAIDDTALTYSRMSPLLNHLHPLNDLIERWENGLCIPPHCFLFNAAIFRKHGISFDTTLPTHEDWECWMNIFALNPEVVFTAMPLANYRRRRDSMCTDTSKMRIGYLMAIDKQIRLHRHDLATVAMLLKKRYKARCMYGGANILMSLVNRAYPALKESACCRLIGELYRTKTPDSVKAVMTRAFEVLTT